MIQGMGTIASQENPQSATPSEEGGARAAIIDAARRLARRDGVVDMTLTGVAKEAGVSATDIYAFFTSKNDLLQAVVADDLAALANTMRRSLEHQPGVADSSLTAAHAIPLQLTANASEAGAAEEAAANNQSHDTPAPPPPAGDVVQNDKPEVPEPSAAAPAQGASWRFPVVQGRRERATSSEANAATAEAIARPQEAVGKLQTAPVDQWLERRLREFERTLYALQHNQNHRASSNKFDQTLQGVRESVEALDMRHAMAADEAARATGERFDVLDKRLREMLSDLQAESVHLARRITALENLAFASQPELMPPATLAFAPGGDPESAVEQPQVAQDAPSDTTQNNPPPRSDEPGPSFLRAARRSATQAAAEMAHADLRQKPPAPKRNKTMLYATCGLVAVFLAMLAGEGLMFRDASTDAPVVHVKVRPAVGHVPTVVAARPLHHVAQKAPQMSVRKLAEAGDASAELLVGLQYLEGKGEPRNDAMAVDWLSRAAAKGQPVAQYDLGALYADGRGVHADAVQAFQWFGAAALRGNRRAMHFLAIAYAEGVGTAKNLPEAARWFERSATLGAVNSQFNLAVLYERGMGVPQSLTTAYTWYAVAAGQGDHEAQARIAALESTLKPDDLANAKAAAAAFKPEPVDPAANLPPQPPS